MLYANKPAKFCTDPGQGVFSSRYYVYKNGIIRAKFAAQDIRVHPGKNICYIDAGSTATKKAKGSTSITIDSTDVSYAALMAADAKYQTCTVGKSPRDFYLSDKGEYDKKWHSGHPIADGFNAKIGNKDVELKSFDRYIAETYGSDDDPETLRDGVQDQAVNLEGFEKWLSDDEQ